MSAIQMPDWGQVFVPDVSLLESFLRGSLIYLSILLLFRVVLKRQGGSIGLPDIMLVVLVSECVSSALSADAKSVPNGLAAVAALLFWNYVIDWLCHRWAWLRRLLEPEPLQIVKDGKPIRKNMDAERISDEELEAQLRENGIDDVAKVKAAFVESEGTVSVIPMDGKKSRAAEPEPHDGTTPDFDRAVQQFLDAAERLQEAVKRHEREAADHRAAAKSARAALARHGVRPSRAPRARGKAPPPKG
jgi:uncharacterized membrane protein YcaP (DUF421 family)